MFPFLRNGIFNVDGTLWKSQRQIASHLFAAKELKGFMFTTFEEHTDIVIKKLESLISSSKENKFANVDMQDLFQRFALDSIGKIAFGVSLGCIESDITFAKDWDTANEFISYRFILPLWKIYKTKSTILLENTVKRIDEYCYNIISQRRKELLEGKHEREDLLTKYLLSKDPETNEPYSDQYLRDIVVSFILAGRDTISQLLSWTLYILSQNPEVEKKLLEEINSLEGHFDYDTIKNMKYLRGVLNETLRLWPPVPNERKCCVKDDTLPNGLFIPAGSSVVWSNYAMGRMKEYWEKPEEIIPERWENKTTFPGFYPFLFGPRICLGQQMAYLEASIALIKILPLFKFTYTGEEVPELGRSVTLKIKHGLLMHVSKRS